MKLYIPSNEIDSYINRFLIIINAYDDPLDKDHFLIPFIDEYLVKKGDITFDNASPSIIQFATIADNVLRFRNDWFNPSIKKWMVNRIRHKDQSEGILFEFRSATHYSISRNHKLVSWIANNDGQENPDIRVVTNSGNVISVECTRKNENPEREINEEKLLNDIKRTLRKKMNQRSEILRPLHLVIYFPEAHEWAYDEFNIKLRNVISNKFENNEHKEKYSIITAVSFISSKLPKIVKKADMTYYSTSLPSITYKNPYAKYSFPDDFTYAFEVEE
jgi:hypothetical protein